MLLLLLKVLPRLQTNPVMFAERQKVTSFTFHCKSALTFACVVTQSIQKRSVPETGKVCHVFFMLTCCFVTAYFRERSLKVRIKPARKNGSL